MGALYDGNGQIENQENEESTLSTGRKLFLLVIALVIFHLIALVSLQPLM